ncbi:carbohydrate kinase family protein [Microbacterium amylolyticum]|uniref:Fructokinase n=1 Tax=Microbacterium amylolyticum TaxID=936337 RepID=A0ABS4ZHP5_9MICO|nr:carbohydrate kinase [Microbacterium amylolyticum]MBP2436727.1 fructokinase [Microbacterium amylolyticum]
MGIALDVLVVGEALIDIVESGSDVHEHVGGSPANVALGLGRLGVNAALLTQVGDDERGKRIMSHIEGSGARILRESVDSRPTSTARARIAEDGAADYVFDIHWEALPDAAYPAPRLVHTGSIGAFAEPGAESVVELLSQIGAQEVTFDPNIRPALVGERDDALRRFEQICGLATVVKMSDEDAAWLFPGSTPDEVIDRTLAMGPRVVAVTLGGDGAILASAADRVRIAPVAVAVADTIGAGDTFMTSLINSVLETGSSALSRTDLERIGTAAARAAAITVSRAGADLPWARELV